MPSRVLEWFWRGSTLAEKRRTLPELGERAQLFAGRARNSADIALGALVPAVPLEITAEASAAELYRQSSYWSLCSLAATAGVDTGEGYSAEIWNTLDEQLLTQVVPDPVRRELLRSTLRSQSFVYFAELPLSEQVAACVELRALAEALLGKLERRAYVLKVTYQQRAWRVGMLVVLVLGVIKGSLMLRAAREIRSDLAVGKAWHASSKYADACTSPEQQCSQSPNFFFHTAEERSPWVEFDLGAPQRLSVVQVENRQDCCTDRVAPMVVEVSDNHKKWRPVARREAEFTTWRASFSPQQARWVRLRVDKQAYLHLARVRIFP